MGALGRRGTGPLLPGCTMPPRKAFPAFFSVRKLDVLVVLLYLQRSLVWSYCAMLAAYEA